MIEIIKHFLFNISIAILGIAGAAYLLYIFAAYLHGSCIGVCP